MRTRLRFAPLRGAVLSCLAKKVPKESAAYGGADECAYRSPSGLASCFSAHSCPPLRTPPGTLRVVESRYGSIFYNSNRPINRNLTKSRNLFCYENKYITIFCV